MLKKLILLILFTSLSAYTHSVKDGDMDGSWQIVEAFINGEKVENANGRMVASAVSYTHLTLPTRYRV